MRRFRVDESYLPKSVTCLRDYDLRKFTGDLIAGLTVGLVALPLAMAFAISSGLSPQSGIYCAIVAGFLISLLGGSKAQIGGPTGAFVVVISGIVLKHGVDGLFMCTLMAGVLLFLMGITGVGAAVKYVPRPVVVGFTNGIAILIASTQIKDFFGLRIDNMPGEFVGRIETIVEHWQTISLPTTAVSLGALAIIVVTVKLSARVPGSIIALILGTVTAMVFDMPLETINSKFGGIPSGLPALVVPTFRPDLFITLLGPTFTITMLGAIESLLSAVVSDRMSGDKHNPNVELMAQGIANIASPLFGGLPATGAIARTASNIRSGAKTPVAGMIHALTLLLILLFAAPLAGHIPLCVLAAILMVVAYHMGEWREVPEILKLSKADVAIWLITLTLTVFADLTVAVEGGMILAALFFIRKVTASTTITEVSEKYIRDGFAHSLQINPIPDGVKVFRIHGPFLFGATDKLSLIEDQLQSLPPVVILRTRNMTAIDATGVHALQELANKLQATDRALIVCGMREQPARLMGRAEFNDRIGNENIQPHLEAAIRRAQEILEMKRSQTPVPV